MTPFYKAQGVTIFHGDCRDVLPELRGETFTACITDPPYGLSFMGQDWDHGVPGELFWTAIKRVMKPGAPLFAFSGTRTFHRQWCYIEDAGLTLKDTLAYMYGAGFPKSHDISKAIDKSKGAEREVVGKGRTGSGGNAYEGRIDGSLPGDYDKTAPATEDVQAWDGWGTALKPSWEPICYAAKPRDDTYAGNALRHGVAGLNIDAARIGIEERVNPPAANDEGGNSLNMSKEGMPDDAEARTAQGRWPANVVLDERASVLLDRQSGYSESAEAQKSAGFRDSANVYGDGTPTKSPTGANDSGGASRFFYTAKASKSDRTKGMPDGATNPHPTVKPTDLIGWLVRLATYPERNHILDPFAGSGTLAYVASQMGVKATLIEQDEESAELCALRLKGQQSLFAA